MNKNELEKTILPVLAMRGLVVFPGMHLQIDVGRLKSVMAVKAALENDRMLFLVTQIDLSEDEPTIDNLYKTGCIGKVKQIVHQSDGSLKLHVEGLERAEIAEVIKEEPYLIGEIEVVDIPVYKVTSKTEAVLRVAKDRFEEYIFWFRHVPPDIIMKVMKEKNCGNIADIIVSSINLSYENKQTILDELNPVKRLHKVCDILTEEIKILKIEAEISSKAQTHLDENQREYILREQMRVIAGELGDEEDPLEEFEEFKEQIEKLQLAEEVEKKLLSECNRLQKLPYSSHEASVVRAYLEICLSLPWNTKSEEKIDIVKAEKILNRDHFGMEKVKERFLELLAVRKLSTDKSNSQIVCLVGPPGVGKTSIAKSIAEAMGRKYVRVSLGGIQDVSDIMGHRKTYVGSMPGRIISAIRQSGVKNPLILLDEIDKLGQSFKGDPSSSLLEVLDSEQNKAFHDHYIDLPFDLSEVVFVTTANNPSYIPSPLYDRMDVITLGSYTANEKLQIAKKYLIPKQLKLHGIKSTQLKISQAMLSEIINGYTREAGVRNVERRIASICRKVAKMIVSDEEFTSIKLTKDILAEMLGPRKFGEDVVSKDDLVGVVNGLAWTSVGGELLPIEVAVLSGVGKIQLTGSLGDVMKESASAAITCIRSRAVKLGINTDFYKTNDIHIHAPEGAIPKDGPSAGVAMSVAICSALTEIPIKHNVAMTGEVTLQGRVLKIGGLREKSMAAYRNGIDTVIIPHENIADLAEVDDVVKAKVNFIPIKNVNEVLDIALVSKPKPLEPKKDENNEL